MSWIEHTPESLNALADHLAEQHTVLPQAEFKSLQIRAGLVYRPTGLLWTTMRAAARLPQTTYWDWMHCTVASGGIAQYEVNQFLRRLRGFIPLERVEAFLEQLNWPSGQKRKPHITFEYSLVDKPRAHLKMFAAETLQVIEGIGALIEGLDALRAFAPLRDEVACFMLLVRCMALLRQGDRVMGYLDRLTALLRQRHDMYLRL